MPVIEIEGLRKEYRRLRKGRTVALDGLDMAVPSGGVFGFLGPNGSGKTTTIRCLLGLVRQSAGRCRILGVDPHTELHTVIDRIGSIVESPALFPGFTGRQNLRLLAKIDGIGRGRVDDVLERVGLADRADDSVKSYSLGMRQRVAIAAALLKDPELLILDEPANGLDPAGIREVRNLLRSLGQEGRTVFVSSHILSEVQAICDNVAILSRGRCVREGSVGSVVGTGDATSMVVGLADLGAGLAALTEAGIDAAIDGQRLRVLIPAQDAALITRTLSAKGLYLTELRSDGASLEDVFIELTEGLGEHFA